MQDLCVLMYFFVTFFFGQKAESSGVIMIRSSPYFLVHPDIKYAVRNWK